MKLLRATPILCAFVFAASLRLEAQLKENLDLPFDAVGEKDDEISIEHVEFYGVTLEGDTFFYVIDRSTTMQDRGELPRAKQEVLENLNAFDANVEFGIIFFDAQVVTFPTSGRPATADPAMKQSAKMFVVGTPPGIGTCGLQALQAALRMASQAKSARKVIVYLSDGGGTCMGADEAAYLKKTLATVSAQNHQRARIHTIGVLDLSPLGEEFMKKLAAGNGGSYTRITR
jgi:Mg-chelatase subunit ChlD